MDKLKILDGLCNLKINERKIAEKLYTLISEDILSESDVIQYLLQKELNYILECFCSIDSNYSDTKRRKPPPVSGSDWTNVELDYYNTNFVDVSYESIVKIVTLSDKATRFIEDNKNLTQNALTEEGEINLVDAKATEFQKHILLVLNNPSKESCVDNMFSCFMRNVLDNEFLVELRYDIQLFVSNTKKKATADIVAILFPQFYIGVIVVEDKSRETSKTDTQWENTEAQMIAEAIAIVQQKKWPKNMPIFMFRVMEIYVSVYKAVFTTEFIDSVKNGIKRNIPIEIMRYSPIDPKFEGKTPGCNLLKSSERELLAKILYSISQEIKTNAI